MREQLTDGSHGATWKLTGCVMKLVIGHRPAQALAGAEVYSSPILARSIGQQLEGALVIQCILQMQPAGLGPMQWLLAGLHRMRYSMLRFCSTCIATSNLTPDMSHLQAWKELL